MANKNIRSVKTLNTTNVINRIAALSEQGENVKVTKNQVRNVLNLLKEVVCEALAEGESIRLSRFLFISPKWRSARRGYNVVEGHPIELDGTVTLHMKGGCDLYSAVKKVTPEVAKHIQGNNDK